jgi:hypothetical protein
MQKGGGITVTMGKTLTSPLTRVWAKILGTNQQAGGECSPAARLKRAEQRA